MKKTLSAMLLAGALATGVVYADDGMWNQIEGNWEQFQGQVKETWADLTDDEVGQLEGNRDQLVGTIREKYGIAQEEAEKQVDEWAAALNLDS